MQLPSPPSVTRRCRDSSPTVARGRTGARHYIATGSGLYTEVINQVTDVGYVAVV